MKIDNNGTELELTFTSDIVAEEIYSYVEQSRVMFDAFDESVEGLSLNLSNVKAIDSSGLNFIIGLYKETMSLNREFKIIGVSEKIIKLFKMCGLLEMLKIEDSSNN